MQSTIAFPVLVFFEFQVFFAATQGFFSVDRSTILQNMCYNKDTVTIHRANSKFEGDGGDGNGFYADGSKIPYSKK